MSEQTDTGRASVRTDSWRMSHSLLPSRWYTALDPSGNVELGFQNDGGEVPLFITYNSITDMYMYVHVCHHGLRFQFCLRKRGLTASQTSCPLAGGLHLCPNLHPQAKPKLLFKVAPCLVYFFDEGTPRQWPFPAHAARHTVPSPLQASPDAAP